METKTKKKRLSRGQIFGVLLGAGLLILFSPLASFVFNSGSVVGMAIGLGVLLIALFFPRVRAGVLRLREKRSGKIALSAVCVLLFVCCVYAATATVLVVHGFQASKTIPENTPAVVLGCAVNGEKPSLMLQKRIDAAYGYLTENPQAVCILSGGKGDDENISEAQAMYNALTAKGISPERLYLEDNSTTTAENIQFSKEILRENGLGETVVLVTTDFHQFRAGVFAENAGLSTYKVCSRSGAFSLPTFIVREWFTVLGCIFGK